MYGAIIGDLAGSIYEFSQIREITNINVNNIIENNSFYSDDTILTIAVLDAMISDKDFSVALKKYGLKYLDYRPDYRPYFKTSFSPGFIKWLKQEGIGYSKGNGAMMRISSVGYLAKTMEEVEKYTYSATIPSHNTKEAIDCSMLVSKIIFLARNNYTKKEIIDYLNIKLEYKPFIKFNTTCYDTIGNCLYALFKTNSFEEAIKEVISYGGDTDTNACIVGSMAEALYGINDELIDKANSKLPREFIDKLASAYNIIYTKSSSKIKRVLK